MGLFEIAVESLLSVSPAQWCQAYYVAGSVIIVSIQVLPAELRAALLNYGARQQQSDPARRNRLTWLLGCLEVPHSWFVHFYLLSVGLSAFWAWQYLTRGWILASIVRAQAKGQSAAEGIESSTGMVQVLVAWALMAAQGGRRLFECLFITKSGKSPMSSLHWLVGVSFYAIMSISVWIEGSGAILYSWDVDRIERRLPLALPIGVALFTMGWLKQYESHAHLASLKKYTLPSEGWFQHIVCPHYTSECLMYLGVSIVAAPPDALLNRTVLLGLVFVMVNLGTTASGTKKWSEQKFGRDKVAHKWRMIPFLW